MGVLIDLMFSNAVSFAAILLMIVLFIMLVGFFIYVVYKSKTSKANDPKHLPGNNPVQGDG